jgi:hypothetical protein
VQQTLLAAPCLPIPRPPPWFNVVLSEPSIKILDDLPEGTAYQGGNANWASERFMVEVPPSLASAPWN